MQKSFKKHKLFLTKKNLTIILFLICLLLILSSCNPVSTIRAVSTRAPNKNPPYIWNGSVTPQSGNTSTIFTYQVSYHDTDNNAPATQDVHIDNFPYVMTLVSGTYTTEAIYQYQTTLWGGNHTCFFYFSDGKWTVNLPASGYYYWPNVTGPPGGWGPQLYQGNVTPQSGSPTTVFTYQVTYYDYFGIPPINKYVYIDGFPFTMTFVSGSYNQGALYQYQTTLGIGNHTYYFNFNNSYGNVN